MLVVRCSVSSRPLSCGGNEAPPTAGFSRRIRPRRVRTIGLNGHTKHIANVSEECCGFRINQRNYCRVRKHRLSKMHSIHRRNNEKGAAAVCFVSAQRNPHHELRRQVSPANESLTGSKSIWEFYSDKRQRASPAQTGSGPPCSTSLIFSQKPSKAVEMTFILN